MKLGLPNQFLQTTFPSNSMKDEDSYKYIKQEENLGYVGLVNKERVTNEYFKHVKKTWKSQSPDCNSYVAYNAFAVPVLIPTFGL